MIWKFSIKNKNNSLKDNIVKEIGYAVFINLYILYSISTLNYHSSRM